MAAAVRQLPNLSDITVGDSSHLRLSISGLANQGSKCEGQETSAQVSIKHMNLHCGHKYGLTI